MIAGQDAQAARIDGQAFGNPELGREIGDDHSLLPVVSRVVPGVFIHVFLVYAAHAVQDGQIGLVHRQFVQALLIDARQQQHRIVAGLSPQFLVYPAKCPEYFVVPGPMQIIGEFLQSGEPFRHYWNYVVFMNYRHAASLLIDRAAIFMS